MQDSNAGSRPSGEYHYGECSFNRGIECYEENTPYKCMRCGWNPEVEKKRRAESRMKRLQAMSENKDCNVETEDKK